MNDILPLSIKTILLQSLKKAYGQVPYGQLPWNPPGRERSKGTWL